MGFCVSPGLDSLASWNDQLRIQSWKTSLANFQQTKWLRNDGDSDLHGVVGIRSIHWANI
jgi:hypothetical protein